MPRSDKPASPRQEEVPARALQEPERGRTADKPSDVPKRGWLDILARTKQQLNEDNLSIIAAGIGFYGFVAVVPSLVAIIAIYALVANPSDVAAHLEYLARTVPGEVMPLLRDQITRIASNNKAAGWSAVLGVLVALYSSANATKAMITGLNVAYDEREKRSLIKLNVTALLLTLAAVVGAVIVLALIAVLPAILGAIGLTNESATLVNWLRWPLLVLLFMIGLACVYRFGPSRKEPKWRWVSWGAGAATLLWVIGSSVFSLYALKFGSYDKTYGSLGAVVVFLFWLYLSAYVVLFGAELNSEMERQTVKDTTTGRPKPLGERGAYSADTVGPSRERSS